MINDNVLGVCYRLRLRSHKQIGKRGWERQMQKKSESKKAGKVDATAIQNLQMPGSSIALMGSVSDVST